MPRTEFVAALERIPGFDVALAECYADAYPPEQRREILDWARSAPGLDACDDVEADTYYA